MRRKADFSVFSVIMAVYNGDRYLQAAIDSVLNQTFRDFEFIIVDDASTDKTPEILQAAEKRDPRIKVVTNTKNRGPYPSANRALKIANAEIIARLDADDWCECDGEIGGKGFGCISRGWFVVRQSERSELHINYPGI